MDRETLLKEHAQCKKRLTTFAILEGVCIGIITLLFANPLKSLRISSLYLLLF